MANRTFQVCRVAAGIFGLVFVLHAWRLVTQTPVVVGTWSIPMGASWVALVLAGGLTWWMWQASGR